MWCCERWRRIPPTGSPAPTPSRAALSPDGRTLVTTGGGTVQLWDVTSRDAPRQLGRPVTGAGAPVVFSPDGRTVATGGVDAAQLWDVSGPPGPRRLGAAIPGRADTVAFSPGGRLLAVSGLDRPVQLWRLR
jgi:WD40 repeat protein